MQEQKVLLGKVKDNAEGYIAGERIWLTKHTWQCDWYWGFGYIGNKNLHTHFSSILEGDALASELFESTNISDNEWWVIRDLFKQAYALREAAAVYRHGGHQTTKLGTTDIIKDTVKAMVLNADLEIVLDKLWKVTIASVK